jgi:hypothetical protein
VQGYLPSEDEGDRVWRRLTKAHRIVVLADGLEEALLDMPGRESTIKDAVDKLNKDRVPLVITSRPDEALRSLDAALIPLEPLPEKDAIEYMSEGRPSVNQDIRKIAEIAEVVETPFYLHLTRDLGDHALKEGWPDERLALRVELLERWMKRLDGERAPVATNVSHLDSRVAIKTVESMACVALGTNTLQLDFESFEDSRHAQVGVEGYAEPHRAAKLAESLDLVERVRNGVRFQHSIMQAYLGARHLPILLADGVLRRNLGRLRRRIVERQPAARLPTMLRSDYLDDALVPTPGRELLMALVMCCYREDDPRLRKTTLARLREAAKRAADRAPNAVAFDLLAAAYEIDRMLDGRGAKALGVVARSDNLWGSDGGLWDAGVQNLGEAKIEEAKVRAVVRMGEVGTEDACETLWHICRREPGYRVRLRAAETLARGGAEAFAVLAGSDSDDENTMSAILKRGKKLQDRASSEVRDVRACSLQGWILPLLATSGLEHQGEQVLGILEEWVLLAERNALHLGVEGYLAQGFKFEANRLPSRVRTEARRNLIGLAERLLDCSRWWYPQVALVQALALWSLDSEHGRDQELKERIRKQNDSSRHPFVGEAAQLCEEAISESVPRPSRYIWIDEPGVVAKVGPGSADSDPESITGRWVSRAAGWYTLKPSAQQLVADTLIYLNLIEGTKGKDWQDREKRREVVAQFGPRLPPCLSGGRSRSDRLRIGDAPEEESAECGCSLNLCPYPTKGDVLFRGELSETFCRGQKSLLRGWKRKHASWQESPPTWRPLASAGNYRALKTFWTNMEKRDNPST